MSDKIKEAEAHMKTAKGHLHPKWYSLTGKEPDSAAREYDKAAIAYRVAKEFDKCAEAYHKCAEAHDSAGNKHASALAYEKAALVYKDRATQIGAKEDVKLKYAGMAAEMFSYSSSLHILNGTADKAGEMLMKAAKVVEPHDTAKALEYITSAVEVYEREDRQQFGLSVFQAAVAMCCNAQEFGKAANLLLRQRVAHENLDSKGSVHVAQLGVIVLKLRQGEFVEADKLYTQFAGDRSWLSSDQCAAADALLDAFAAKDEARIKEAVKNQTLTHMDPAVTRVAKSLRLEHCSFIPAREGTMTLETFAAAPDASAGPSSQGGSGDAGGAGSKGSGGDGGDGGDDDDDDECIL